MKTVRVGDKYKAIMTMVEYEEMRSEYSGVCMDCGFIMDTGCEPDMIDGECDNCGNVTVMGIEEMLIQDLVVLEE